MSDLQPKGKIPEIKRIVIDVCQACLDGVGKECHTPGCALYLHSVDIEINEYTVLDEITSDAISLKSRLRNTAQILIDKIGADGPMNAEDAAQKAVDMIASLEEENRQLKDWKEGARQFLEPSHPEQYRTGTDEYRAGSTFIRGLLIKARMR